MTDSEKYALTLKVSDIIYRMFEGKKTTHSDVLEKANQLLPILVPFSPDSEEYNDILNSAISLYEQEVGVVTFDPNIIDNDYDQDLWLYKVKPNILHS